MPHDAVAIGRFQYRSRAAAERAIRKILQYYGNGRSLGGEHLAFITALIDVHPRRTVIVDCGIREIRVQWLDDKGVQRRFLVVRTDSSIRDFSWRPVIYPLDALDKLRKVCRTLIHDQIERFKELAFFNGVTLQCPISGKRLTRDSCDIDHQTPNTFQALVDGWLAANRITAEDVEIVPSPRYQEPDHFADTFLESNWRKYHRENACLRAVDPSINRSFLRKKGN